VEPLLAQFSARQVVVLGDAEEERLAPSFWLAPPPVDEADQDMDQVTHLFLLSTLFIYNIQYIQYYVNVRKLHISKEVINRPLFYN
jgi:hypothetical protein